MWNIGERIKLIRQENNITQEALCGSDLNRTTLSKIENNLQEPSLSQLYHICRKLNISVSSLFYENNVIMDNFDTMEGYLYQLYNNKDYSGVIRFHDLYKKEFSSLNDKVKFFYVGMSYFYVNLFSPAIKHLNKFVSYYLKKEAIQDKRILEFCESLNTMYKIEMSSNKPKAISHLNLANMYITKFNIENTELAFKILNNICVYYLRANNYSTVVNFCKYFESMNPTVCYPRIFSYLYSLLSITYYNIDNYDRSILCIKKSINILLFMDEEEKAGLSYINYINALRYSKSFSDALRIIEFCKNEFSSFETVANSMLFQEMVVYFNMNDYEGALSVFKSINTKRILPDERIEISFVLGIIDYKNGLFPSAMKRLKKCEKYFLKYQHYNELELIYNIFDEVNGDVTYGKKLDSFDTSKRRKNILI